MKKLPDTEKCGKTDMSEIQKSFRNWREGAVHLNFPNGNHISTTWARCSYSDNYDMNSLDLDGTPKYKSDRINPIIESDTCEMTIDCGDKLLKRLERKFNSGDNQPFGYMSITNWLYILNAVANEKPPTTPDKQ